MSYVDSYHPNYDLRYAHLPLGGSWSTVVVDSSASTGDMLSHASLAVDSSGGVHLAYEDYQDDSEYDLVYASLPSGGSWTKATVDSSGSTGYYPAIAVDSSGNLHIAYLDGTHETLRYAGWGCP